MLHADDFYHLVIVFALRASSANIKKLVNCIDW